MNNIKYAAIRPTKEIVELFEKVKQLEKNQEQNVDRQSIFERALNAFEVSDCDIKDVREYKVQINEEERLHKELPSSFKLRIDNEIIYNSVKTKIKNEYNLKVVQIPFLLKIVLKYYIKEVLSNKEINYQKRKQVYEVLLLPIVVKDNKHKKNIFREHNKIFSTQQYKLLREGDPDMSDFSCRFYEVMYKNIMVEKSIVGGNNLVNIEFAGDIMNSFNTVARLVKEAGRSKEQRTPKEQWPTFLQEYHDSYHCLANMWMIPSELGRNRANELSKTDKGYQTQDYMDRFLIKLIKNYERYCDEFKEYFSKFKSIEDFIVAHYLEGYVYVDNEVYCYSKKRTPEEIIKSMKDRIKIRASHIALSDKAKDLWSLFNELGLIKTMDIEVKTNE